MRLGTLFTITAVVMLFFGTTFILVPRLVFGVFAVQLDAAGVMLATVAGAALFALGTLAAYFRSQSAGGPATIAARTLFTFFILKTVVTLVAQLQGVFNPLGWSIVVLDLLLTVGYAYQLIWGRERVAAA